MFEKAAVLSGDMPLAKASIGYAYAKSGKADEARKIISELAEASKLDEPPLTIAAIYASLGDKDTAFEWLEKAYAARGSRIIDINKDPMLDELRSDPRFQDFLRRLSLAP
jgi:tetratricopeptide (TPR) repeat protein